MYSSRGNNAYGQQQQPKSQSYAGQSAFSQNAGPDGASQLPMASRHSSLLGSHPSAGPHYGGQYASVYGSTAHSSALQAPTTHAKGAGSSVLDGRSGYGSTLHDSPKYTPGGYTAASQKYAERPSAYSGRDLQSESGARFADSIGFGHQHQTDIYDRLDAATALRQELLHKSLQPASVDASSRQADYLATRAATVRHAGQEILPYGGRIDADLHTLSMISGTQHASSILGAASRREVDDLVYASGNPGYGVSLPQGRDYAGGVLSRAGYSRLDDINKDMDYARELERREEDRLREILRDRERERDRSRDRRDRERDRDRERERERERERDRERRRELERILERREKERERDIRRDRSPLRISRDRGRSTSTTRARSLRRETPRRRSPVKEKRREYVCKVYTSNLVDPERDYLSMDKRYSRLFVSPECSKVVVNWSKEDLNIPFNTPISFEHDFVQEETSKSTKTVTNGHAKLENGTTRWNAKMLLMSGLSRNAWEELSSDRKYEDRIPHLCNMLRFAFLKDGSTLMPIGGSCDTVDGNDPSVNKSTLIQTVLRFAKELTGLDLKNCRNWNPFLEIHYDRVGKDGLFSHKEITVLYIPDLSDCLPSIDAWRDQWLAHKKAVAERERLRDLKREKSREKKEVSKDKELKTKKDLKDVEKQEKKKETGSSSKVNGEGKVSTPVKAEKSEKEGDKTVTEKKKEDKTVIEKKKEDKTVIEKKKEDKIVIEKKNEDKTVTEKKNEVETVDEGKSSEKKQADNASSVETPETGKKKIIRKVVKKKVVPVKDGAGNASKQTDTKTEVVNEDAESSGTPLTAKTSTKKKVIKKTPVVKTVKKEDEVKETECSDDKTKTEDVKTTAKKKIVKKVTKKNVADADLKDNMVKGNETGSTVNEVKVENTEAVLQDVAGSTEVTNKNEKVKVKEEEKVKVKEEKKAKVEGGSDKNDKLKGEKEKKDKDVRSETKGKEVKDKKKVEEPPRHPGLILQTKGNKNSKQLRSSSLSLDSLLDYNDKDIEESTFELSLFAETFYEMLQYQMGSRILTFLQKLRIKFVDKRNKKKRQREEASEKKEKEKSKRSSPKRQKTDDVTDESKSVKTEILQEDEKDMVIDNVENTNKEDETEKEVSEEEPEEEEDEDPEEEPEELEEDPEEEPEEDPEEEYEEEPEEDDEKNPEDDEHMADANPKIDAENEEKAEVDKVDTDVKSETKDKKAKNEQEDNVKETASLEKKEKSKVDTDKKKDTSVTIDKELLQAFRFFDRNRVGYVRVEDLRLILHSLGKNMSHRDVKELVQSALLESNTGRDDQILYRRLVKMTDI